jgi:hypothetical protein
MAERYLEDFEAGQTTNEPRPIRPFAASRPAAGTPRDHDEAVTEESSR